MKLLAGTTDCRNGNCPTVWLTAQGSVVVQGYIVSDDVVRVPRDIVDRATRELEVQGAGRCAVTVPGAGGLRVRGEWIDVGGTPTSLSCPAGERAHEVPVSAVHEAAIASARGAV